MNTKSDGTLRSIARELGMVSSAIYRYVDSRDDLLTRLIIEAYDPLGSAAEAAVAASTGQPDAERWVATALAIRDWARGRPHEYMLLYGTPVPGYAAPDDTVAPGTRVTLALLSIVRDAATGGRLSAPTLVVDAPTRLPTISNGWQASSISPSRARSCSRRAVRSDRAPRRAVDRPQPGECVNFLRA